MEGGNPTLRETGEKVGLGLMLDLVTSLQLPDENKKQHTTFKVTYTLKAVLQSSQDEDDKKEPVMTLSCTIGGFFAIANTSRGWRDEKIAKHVPELMPQLHIIAREVLLPMISRSSTPNIPIPTAIDWYDVINHETLLKKAAKHIEPDTKTKSKPA